MTTVSVPSRGLRYLNGGIRKHTRNEHKVSVPSRGLRYLNNEKKIIDLIEDRFRPLTGIKVSERGPKEQGGAGMRFPSPHGD